MSQYTWRSDIRIPNLDLERIEKHGCRHYVIDDQGTAVPSVTSVLGAKDDGSLDAWVQRVGEKEAERISRTSANKGTQVHLMCENRLNNIEMPKSISPMARLEYRSIERYLDNIDNIIGTELRLFSKTIGMAGTADCVAEYNGRPAIIDFKTSRRMKKRDWIQNYFAQATAYAIMVYELFGIECHDLVIIIGNPEGGQVFIEKPADHYEYLMECKKEFDERIKQRQH